uniref:Uncharacterized protein MANES_01G065400 n=4 Tax=Rhizophora mucronata TaxID=61149 RepID=A0A2P2M0U9_RHIMU
MEQKAALLQRYRLDRRKLIGFLYTSGLIKELRTPSGPIDSFSEIDFDAISADHILQCIKSGGVLDITEATEKYLEESASPVMIQAQAGDSYFLVSDADSSGSPPRRVPPPISVKQAANSSTMPCRLGPLEVETAMKFGDHNRSRYKTARNMPMKPSGNSVKASEVPPLGLPSLKTGLSDDDLRESAYELLMASMFFSGDEVHVADDRKKEKGSKLLSGLKSKKEKMLPHHPSLGRHSALMDIVRVQMQISEAMHACIRRNLLQLVARKISQIDLPHISLELLNGIFKSDFPNEKSYMQWRSREANILEELLCIIANSMTTEVRSHVAKIRDTKQWDAAMSPSERVAVIASIRQVAMKLSSLPGKFGIEGETFYWTAGYHLNIRLYLNLLFAVFDILEEGQLIEEADDLLSIIKLTWSTLGITRKMHNALYGWVLFQQFLETDGDGLLENAVLELQKLLSAAEDDDKEEQYMNSLLCLRQWNGSELKVRLVQTILLSVTSWCDSVLQDYHLHFGQKFSNFRMVVTMVFEVGIPTDDCGEIKLTKLNASNQNSTRMLKLYVKRSTEAAYSRVASKMDLESKVERTHPLALLANELKLIAEREFKVFYPVLRECFPESMRISVFLLHQFYGEKLVCPYLIFCWQNVPNIVAAVSFT